MSLSARTSFRFFQIVLFIAFMFLALPAVAQRQVVVGVVTDGPSDRFEEQRQRYVDELLALTAGEFDVQIRHFSGAWSKESIDAVLDEAYADAEIDLVLVTGFVANQIAATQRSYSKPTFLPLIIDTGLIDADVAIGRSGVRNLNFLSAYADFADDLDTLSRIVSYRNLVLFLDAGLESAIPELRGIRISPWAPPATFDQSSLVSSSRR